MSSLSRISLYSLDEEDDYMGACVAGLALPTWLGFVSHVEGTLHVSTKRILFDPTDHSRPVHYFAVKDITEAAVEPGESSDTPAGTVSFVCAQYKLGPVDNKVGPLQRPEKAQDKWLFRLHRSAASAVKDSLRAVLMLANTDAILRRCEAALLQRGPRRCQSLQHSGGSSAGGDTASFPAWRVSALREQRGVVHVSAVGITFDPLYPMAGNRLGGEVHLAATAIAHVFPRTISFEASGLDIYTPSASKSTDRAAPEDCLALALRFTSAKDREHALVYLQRATNIPLFRISFGEALRDWQARRLSNYQYLQLLNKLASRSEEDLSQYPVFPWVLRDYTSAELRLDDPAAYRDLARPIGALNEGRLRELQERQAALEGVDEGSGQRAGGHHLYSTHYSSAGAVAYYLVRPHPEYQLCLQRGRFDHPQRIFASLAAAWASVLGNASDFKELIPDFFDSSRAAAVVSPTPFGLGVKDDGSEVPRGVVLPPWAHGPPIRFAQLHVAALESEFVSAHLHEWIDLIFGHKQSGENAERAANTFHPYSYPPPPGRNAAASAAAGAQSHVRAQYAREFGCTPTKLFTAAHPARFPTAGERAHEAMSDILTNAARAFSHDDAAATATAPLPLPSAAASATGSAAEELRTSAASPMLPIDAATSSALCSGTTGVSRPLEAELMATKRRHNVTEVTTLTVMSATAAAEMLSGWREVTNHDGAPPPCLMVLSNLTFGADAGSDEGGESSEGASGETLLTMVCDARRLTVCIFDCVSGERLRTFADFQSPIALLGTHSDHVLLFTARRDLFVLRPHTRAVADHLESFSDGVPVLSFSSGPAFGLVDGESRVRVWHLPQGERIAESLQEEDPLTEFEAPTRILQFALEANEDDILAVAATADDELWWWWYHQPIGEASGRRPVWHVCAIEPRAIAGVPGPVLGLAAFVGQLSTAAALVLRDEAVQLWSLSGGGLLAQYTAVEGHVSRFIGGFSTHGVHALPFLCVGAQGSCVLVTRDRGMTTGIGVETLTWPGQSHSLTLERGHAVCCSDGLVATLTDSGTVIVYYCEGDE